MRLEITNKASDATLAQNIMGTNLNELHKFNGKSKFHAAVANWCE
jgi:hypothetical protein